MADDRSASMLELMAIDAPTGHYDVAILGGGLAGLTLAIQLKRQRPDTSVAVLEKRDGPAPLAAFKVGESTVPSCRGAAGRRRGAAPTALVPAGRAQAGRGADVA